ncbi:hypothetical protein TIFTF001_054032 [Ficus carica]|uniref:Uncharacterized protein n=1 Tax=Ficus carica TaxID=3494 RepID=A0AA88JGC6_FICCA|nr:hypothetical protein TIFTF001_054032 [Ficus carica]
MLVSFCAGHVFILNQELRYVAYPLYAALCFPITFFGLAQLSLYFDLVLAILKKIPQRCYRTYISFSLFSFLDHRPRVLPLDPNIPLPREGLRLGLAPETSSRLDVALFVHNLYAGVVLRGT